MTKLPTLYKRTATGALQEWTVFSESGFYWTEFGQTGGIIQTSERVACEPKNVGRANETTAVQQADLEAKALHTKKLRKDYTLDPNAKAGQTSELIEGGVLPMLAHKFSEHGDKLKYPCFVQPKLDGLRCIAIAGGGLWSRTRKPITGVPHIQKAIDAFANAGYIFDGELYAHSHKQQFEQIVHLVRQETPTEGHEAIQYHIYDMPNTAGQGFGTRYAHLKSAFEFGDPLVLVETREVANEDELMLAFEDFLAQGYEGAIARNADGLYLNKRSYDLLKIKKFDDGEFICAGVEEGKGKMAGHAVFVCRTEVGTAFKAKMKGDHDSLVQYYKHPELVVGKMVTIKYQGLTNKNGVPRFPVALRIREDV